MLKSLRGAVALAAVLFAVSCGPAAEPPAAATSAAPNPEQLAGGPVEPTPPAKPSPFPQWLQIAQQAGGGSIQYHPASIQRDSSTGIADVWVQVIYAAPQIYTSESKVATQRIEYTRERFLFRFDCNNVKYAIMDRRIMGVGETVAEDIPTVTQNDQVP